MRNRCCVWALLALGMCLLATRAMSETMIEVDENGDEYELKRFYIQGRQLKGDGSQSQCVVTRRKRSGRALQSGAGSASAAAATVSVSSQPLNVESLPAKEHREGGAVLQEVENSNRRYVALTGVHLESPLPQDLVHNLEDEELDEELNDDDEDDDDNNDDVQEVQSSKGQSNYVPAALALPLQSQSTAAHLNQGVSVVANAASHANVAEDAGIVVVQSHQPPKVNPDTHAVFELKPVQSDVDHHQSSNGVSFYHPFVQPWEVVDQHEDDYDEDDYDEEDYDDFYYGNGYYRDQPGFHNLGAYEEHIISEDEPVTTIASWTTGDDDSDIRPVPNKRPNQKNKNKNKKNQKNKNQNQKNKRQQQKKRKQESQNEEQPVRRRQEQKKKQQQQHQDKDQKKKQDKDQKKKKPEENQDQEENMENLTPVEVIKKPVTTESSATVGASSTSSNSNTVSSSSNSSGSNSTDKKKKKKKRPSSSSSSSSSSLSQRKTKKKKKQSTSSSSSLSISTTNKRRRPSSTSSSYSGSSSSSIGGYRRRRPQQQQQQQLQQQRRRKTQQQQKRRRQQQQQQQKRRRQQQRRRLRNKNRQFYGDEPIINCIYINKDPPTTTTTARPFWNILGRQSESEVKSNPESTVASSDESQVDPVAQQAVLQAVRRNFGDFGGRKRTNLRFVS
ncbi:putative uncharacterized protein DDB_G0289963 [Drosophila eugracilis]|uniref:putative uncharacterized protein DDB_G0289963 n=1 Tax=Drosophila eugracilis TaxID=29029 RepID=UPI0007E82541|nr:putative uncharacterized protein DDB_G0289963 [Drosophila eugracilis]